MKVELKNMNKSFGKQKIFDNFNITVESGEMVCILGKSGSGKTTLLNILGLIEKKDHGTIIYNTTIINTEKKQRSLLSNSIGFIFQNFGLIDNETVYQNLSIIKQLNFKKKKEKIKKIKEILDTLDLSEEIIYKKVYECSGGEQQRVAIAKILIKECDIIFADEPTASLDKYNKIKILDQLKKLNRQGKTIVIVSHDDEICNYCDRVVTL